MTKRKKQAFTQHFGDNGRYICEGDSITCTVNGFDVEARIVHDEYADCGFWPSINPGDAGYIGSDSKVALARQMALSKRVMEAWEHDEWFYCGVVVTVSRCEVELAKESLWGIECNFPVHRERANAYLRDVANELLLEAIDSSEAKLEELLQTRGAA